MRVHEIQYGGGSIAVVRDPGAGPRLGGSARPCASTEYLSSAPIHGYKEGDRSARARRLAALELFSAPQRDQRHPAHHAIVVRFRRRSRQSLRAFEHAMLGDTCDG